MGKELARYANTFVVASFRLFGSVAFMWVELEACPAALAASGVDCVTALPKVWFGGNVFFNGVLVLLWGPRKKWVAVAEVGVLPLPFPEMWLGRSG
jgi:hypothetical protein